MSAPTTSVREHRAPLTAAPRSIDVRNPAGSVTVRADEHAPEVVVRLTALDRAAEEVLDRVQVVATGSALRVAVPQRRLGRSPEVAVEVLTPPGAEVAVTAGSASVTLEGRLGAGVVTAASGAVAVERCAGLQVRSAGGDVRLGSVAGAATVATASGDVRIGSAAGPVQVRTASGDVTVGDAATDVRVSTASGEVVIGRARAGTVQLKTVSAGASVAVEPGLRVWLDVQSVSGRLDLQLQDDTTGPDGAADLRVLVSSVSGDVRLRRAAREG
ncbi:DUF4097 family beta strand repeat-containing protein [Modestobacter sp. NPDC049651]|uniref:DUF4097 family beta strand repeat-containing protein n=1 Tax=unclassified Modestobacter TaxID=2643866 RepID=UPI0033EC5F01